MKLRNGLFFLDKIRFFSLISFISIVFLCCSPLTHVFTSKAFLDYASDEFQSDLSFASSSNQSFDGWYSGIWQLEDTQLNGSLNGTFSFGRSDTIAIIQGNLYCNSSLMHYSMKAWVQNHMLIGVVSSPSLQRSRFFLGKIQLSMPLFSFSILIPSVGKVIGSGSFDGSFLPSPTGPYQVGIKNYHLIDESREEWFTEEDESDFRELMVQVWYPSKDNYFSFRADYMDPITFSWLRDQGPVPLITIPKDAYRFVHPFLYKDVEPARSECFPVLLFSPGYDGVDAIYTSFIDELVSYGYIVVSINHPYVSGVTVFPDGRAVYIADLPGDFSESAEFLKHSQQTVVDDVLYTLDYVEMLNQTDELLSGIFDFSRIGMFGHSFGGAATINCCFLDDRIQAGFTLDGVVYNEFITDHITDPFLLMCAEQRFNHSSYDYVWSQFSSDAFQVGVNGSSHYGFTDVGVLLSHMLPLIPSSILGFGTVDSSYLIKVTRSFEKAFFDVYLKGVEKEVLLDLFDDFENVMIRTK
jgi:dienelactone hydrolase